MIDNVRKRYWTTEKNWDVHDNLGDANGLCRSFCPRLYRQSFQGIKNVLAADQLAEYRMFLIQMRSCLECQIPLGTT